MKTENTVKDEKDPFLPGHEQAPKNYLRVLKDYNATRTTKLTVQIRESINSKLTSDSELKQQRVLLVKAIPIVCTIITVYITCLSVLLPTQIILGAVFSPVVVFGVWIASAKYQKQKLSHPRQPFPLLLTSKLSKPSFFSTLQKLGADNMMLLLFPISTVACVSLYLLQAPYFLHFFACLMFFYCAYLFRVWLKTKRIQIRMSVRKHGKKPKKPKNK